MYNKKDPFGYEDLNRYRSYKWVKYVLKVQHIMINGFEKIKWYYVTAISVNNAIDQFRAQYAESIQYDQGEYMLILGVYDKPGTMYIGDSFGIKIHL